VHVNHDNSILNVSRLMMS